MKKGGQLKSALAREPGTVRVSPGVYRKAPVTLKEIPVNPALFERFDKTRTADLTGQMLGYMQNQPYQDAYRYGLQRGQTPPTVTPEMQQQAAAQLNQMRQIGAPLQAPWYATAMQQLQQAQQQGRQIPMAQPAPTANPSANVQGLVQSIQNLPPPMPRPVTGTTPVFKRR